MPNVKGIAKATAKAVSENSPAILTAIAVAGVVTTSFMAVRSTPRAIQLLEAEEKRRQKEDPEFISEFFTPMDRVKITWKCYVPAAAMGAATMVCIVGVNSIHTRRNAALASVYSLTETAFKEYQGKVVETIGKKAEQKVRDQVAEDRVAANPVGDREIIITGTGDMRMYDSLSGRYFTSNVEACRKAENLLNAEIIDHMYVSLNEYYEAIGLSRTPYGDESGWKIGHLLDLDFTAMMGEGDPPVAVISVNHKNLPRPEYYKGY